jgi:hypothetical protein
MGFEKQTCGFTGMLASLKSGMMKFQMNRRINKSKMNWKVSTLEKYALYGIMTYFHLYILT